MRRVRLSVAVSLDGYIARPNGEIDWIVMDPDIDFAEYMGSFDAVLMGRKTYEETQRMEGAPAMPGTEVFVFSRTLKQGDCEGATVSDDPAGVVAALKKKEGKDIWLFGGGELFAGFLELGLVDAVEVGIMPALLGGGLPLLPSPGANAKLQLTKHEVYPKTGTIMLEYAVS